MLLISKSVTLCQDISISNIDHDISSDCSISLYIHGSMDSSICACTSDPLIFDGICELETLAVIDAIKHHL